MTFFFTETITMIQVIYHAGCVINLPELASKILELVTSRADHVEKLDQLQYELSLVCPHPQFVLCRLH